MTEKLRVDRYHGREVYEKKTGELSVATDPKEERKIEQYLHQQLSNAHTEALKINEEMDSETVKQEALKRIDAIESDTLHTMERDGLSSKAAVYGHEIVTRAEEAKNEFTSKKKLLSVKTIIDVFKAIQELYQKFKELAGNVLAQDRFGGPQGV